MRPMLGALSERLGEGAGPMAGPLRSVSGCCSAFRSGALTGMLSQRVLGQYDLALLDSDDPPRLLLLAPNLASGGGQPDVDREELLLWVTIHEITHAVQFSGAPWLRAHIGGMLSELMDGLQVALGGRSARDNGEQPANGGAGAARAGGWAPRLPDPGELREMLERARRGELLRLTLGEDRWAARRADAGGDVADRGSCRAHDGRRRRRGAAVAAGAARRDDPPARRNADCRGACSRSCSASS